MKVKYKDVKDYLRAKKVAFSNKDWLHRHKDEDILEIPDHIMLEPNVAFLGGSTLVSMGAFSYSWSALPNYAKVGRYCSIAKGFSVVGVRHPYEWLSTSSFTYDNKFCIFDDGFPVLPRAKPRAQLEIGHDVWIGANVVVSRNITIGTGAVIAGNSVVVKDVLPYEIVGGNPAKHIKFRFPEPVRQKLLAVQWWNYHYKDFANLDIQQPEIFVAQLESLIASQQIQTYEPEKLNKRLIEQWLNR